MSVQAVKDVLDYAPTDLSPSERLVLLVVAEDIRKNGLTRDHGGVAALSHRSGLSDKTVRNVTSQLVRRGLILPQVRARVGVQQVWKLGPLNASTRSAVFDPRKRGDDAPARQATITPITTTLRRTR